MPSFSKKKMKRKKGRARNCFYCGCHLHNKNKTIDHVKPIAEGGTNEGHNLVICCKDCNEAKGDMSLVEFQKMKFEAVTL